MTVVHILFKTDDTVQRSTVGVFRSSSKAVNVAQNLCPAIIDGTWWQAGLTISIQHDGIKFEIERHIVGGEL